MVTMTRQDGRDSHPVRDQHHQHRRRTHPRAPRPAPAHPRGLRLPRDRGLAAVNDTVSRPPGRGVFRLLAPGEERAGVRPPHTDRDLVSSLLSESDALALKDQYVGKTAALLGVACLGAFLLLAINFVGIFFCKGAFKKKGTPPAPVSGTYPASLSACRRHRYHAILRRFSLNDPMSLDNLPPDTIQTYCFEASDVRSCADNRVPSNSCFGRRVQSARASYTVVNASEVLLTDESPQVVATPELRTQGPKGSVKGKGKSKHKDAHGHSSVCKTMSSF